mmetsp:Transcript_62929/g.198747  ORF Transcript_62929/g.198747 Transcript_62929/m.198747 type:complete len:269 (-) Transcript_62929:91-897(-)
MARMGADARAALGLGLLAATVCIAGLAFVPSSGSSALAARQPPLATLSEEALRGGLAVRQARLVRPGIGENEESGLLGGRAGPAAFSLACCAALLALQSARSGLSKTAMQYRKRYGGGPVKKDPAAEFGPQYWGPPIDYGIQRKARLGMPKGGEQRVIPKLSGGSYDARKNMMRNLTTELIRHGRIKTTRARAEALQSFVDRMIVLAKRGDDLARREANEWMFDESLVENLFKLAPERYVDQKKDFTQVTPTMNRKGDWAEMAYIELI